MIARRGPATGRALPRAMRDTAPLLHVDAPSARSLGVSQGNRTRRINEMRRAREAMAAALGGHDETYNLDA